MLREKWKLRQNRREKYRNKREKVEERSRWGEGEDCREEREVQIEKRE